MPGFDSNIEKLKQKKKEIVDTQKKKETGKNLTRTLPKAPQLKERTQEKTTSAYRQILATDFQSADWISKEAPLRKHRKNINTNYKSLTGRKRGLSSAEKLKRKDEFEARRDISLKASMALAEFIGSADGLDPDPEDENLMRTVEEMDLSQFAYGDGADVAADDAFVSDFSGKMSILQNASLLYDKILKGNSDLASPEILRKLSQMNDMRQAYEDRIRIISSPYYVSLRDVDFDKSTKEKLLKEENEDKKDKQTEEDKNLRAYAKSMIRWQESGKKLLTQKKAAAPDAPAENVVQDDTILSDAKTYVSDQAVDNVIKKVNGKNKTRFKKLVSGERDMAMAFTREWVYKDLNSKTEDKAMLNEVDRMKEVLNDSLGNQEIKESDRKNIEKLLRHLDRVSTAFASKKISSDAMRIWLDRCLQHKLNFDREIYLSIVHQGKTNEDENRYFTNVKKVIDPYVNQMSGVIFAQSKYKEHGVYQRAADAGETEDPAILKARRGKTSANEFSGMSTMKIGQGNDFIHISGKNADYNDISTRAYVSAKPKYKSLAVKLFTETLGEFEHKNMRDEIYFKISSEKDRDRGYATDDLTIYLGSNVSLEERKQILDRFYEKCRTAGEKGESILDGENMTIAGSKYQDGIALAGEPDIATLLNYNFSNANKKFRATFSDRGMLEKINNMSSDKAKEKFSFNTFVTAMLVQSTFVAGHRLGTKPNTAIDTNDPKVREETKRVFRELCFLNGINPETMGDIDNKTILG